MSTASSGRSPTTGCAGSRPPWTSTPTASPGRSPGAQWSAGCSRVEASRRAGTGELTLGARCALRLDLAAVPAPLLRPGVRARDLRRGSLGGDAREARDDLLAVGLERLLLALGHQVDVELVDADRLELLQLGDGVVGRAENAEAVADLVGDELAVRGADAAVVLVVVELARLHVVGQRLGDLGVEAVPLHEVHDVVRDHGREPAHLVA